MNVTKPRDTKITTMRFSRRVMDGATRRATQLGMTRTEYVEKLIRRDLRMPMLDSEPVEGVFA